MFQKNVIVVVGCARSAPTKSDREKSHVCRSCFQRSKLLNSFDLGRPGMRDVKKQRRLTAKSTYHQGPRITFSLKINRLLIFRDFFLHNLFTQHIMLRDLFTQKCVQNFLFTDFGYPEHLDSENIKF
jgi:hypothetical protein